MRMLYALKIRWSLFLEMVNRWLSYWDICLPVSAVALLPVLYWCAHKDYWWFIISLMLLPVVSFASIELFKKIFRESSPAKWCLFGWIAVSAVNLFLIHYYVKGDIWEQVNNLTVVASLKATVFTLLYSCVLILLIAISTLARQQEMADESAWRERLRELQRGNFLERQLAAELHEQNSRPRPDKGWFFPEKPVDYLWQIGDTPEEEI